MAKKILITGSNGLLGQKLVALLANHSNHQLIATSLGTNRIRKIEGFEYHSLDITDRAAVNQMIDRVQPDVIINTAAMTNVDACESAKDDCWNLNVKAVEYLVEASERNQVHLIHLSTDFVFDGETGAYREEDVPRPVSFYGWSKYASEVVLQQSKLKNWSIARTIIVYGIVEDMSRSNVVLWAKGAMEKGSPINVVDDQFRSPTLAEDLAQGCVLIAEKEANGIFHLSGKNTMSILELVRKVGEFFNLDTSIISPIKSESLGQTAQRPPRTGFDITKAQTQLNYQPRSFVEGLEVVKKQLV